MPIQNGASVNTGDFILFIRLLCLCCVDGNNEGIKHCQTQLVYVILYIYISFAIISQSRNIILYKK